MTMPWSILSRTTMLAHPLRPQVRHLHASLVRRHLVGPPDPISNLRPVIYDDAVPEHRTDVTHPYSLREFGGDTREYQWKMQRQELDAHNHQFWKEVCVLLVECLSMPAHRRDHSIPLKSNTRFYAAKEAVLQSLPEETTPEQREVTLSDFYRRWVAQERKRSDDYGEEWRRRNWAAISLGARVQYEKFVSRIMHPFR